MSSRRIAYYFEANNLRDQHGDMHIAATVTFVRIYGKITEYIMQWKITMCTKHNHFNTVDSRYLEVQGTL